MMNTATRIIYSAAIIGLAIAANGCLDAPRPRMGCLPTHTFAGTFLDPENLGSHSYGPLGGPFEGDGIVYTCKGGNIDVTHLRWNADYTRYAVNQTKKTLMRKGKGFSFNLAFEPSTHQIRFSYPDNWGDLPKQEKEKIADEAAFAVGPYVAYGATMWHEILTWFGTHYMGVEPEFNSAFSWEDSYSNLLGTHLAVRAMRNKEHSYDKAMTIAIEEELDMLGVQPRSVAIAASEKVRGKWYKGNFQVDISMRNLDMGLDDGFVSPTIIPDVAECDGEPVDYPVPNVDILDKYGLAMTYEIKANVFEQGKVFKVIDANRIYPAKHYPAIMAHINKEATDLGHTFIQ
ncbi:MAG: DUF4056 domain-containing protein [Planctomycetes bacterium]|nr:DUF4056 domain-containing protein [Planctomycetota bacterium]